MKALIYSLVFLTSLSISFSASCSGSGGVNDFGSTQDPVSVALSPLYESSLAGSTYHNPNSTWWGYNMSKVVRYNNIVYLGLVVNDSSDGSVMGDFKIYRGIDGGAFTEIASFPTSRPGNIVVGSTGEIYVFTFEAFDASTNDSIGSLVVNESMGASGTPTFTREVIVTAPNATDEHVNIRIGASISATGKLAVAYGLNEFNPINSTQTIQLHIKDGAGWRLETFTSFTPGDESEYYYPYVTFDDSDNVYILPVQDEYYLPGGGASARNRYHKMPYLRYDESADTFDFIMIEDVSTSVLASSEDNILEQKEVFYDDMNLETLFIYRQKTSSTKEKIYLTTRADDGTLSTQHLAWATNIGANWVRLFRFEGGLYAAVVSWDKLYFANVETGVVKEMSQSVPTGSYMYTSSPRGGTSDSSTSIDLMIISGNSSSYPGSSALILTYSKSEIANLFN